MKGNRSELSIQKTGRSRLKEVDFDRLGFGTLFSDHMLEAHYEQGRWNGARIRPYESLLMAPSTIALHYGQAVFEGLKAFRYREDAVSIFRADRHYERFAYSCERLGIPVIGRELFLEGMKALVELDRKWVPEERYRSLYIRPYVMGTEECIGLKSSGHFRFMIITGPVGDYYEEGIKPISLTTRPEYVRAVRGGAGEAKTPGNYAPTLLPASLAARDGFTQVLWLDAHERRYVEEVGTMNIFFCIDDKLVTPSLSGSILDGVTRDSVLRIAENRGMDVEQRPVAIDELFECHRQGRLTEVFGTGTAAVISPVGRIHHEGDWIILDQENMGPVAGMFYRQITGVHHGDEPDPGGWCTVIP